MEKDVENAVDVFEKNNGFSISNYYCKKKPSGKFTISDKNIGEDVFANRISEWLEICEDEVERKYLLELLGEYLYFPSDRFEQEFEVITQKLEYDGVDIEKTLFVTFPSKKGVASGGDKVASALMIAIMDSAEKENIITDVERANEDLLNRITKYKYIVFVDDIIGSGKTLNTNITDFFGRFSFENDVVFYIACLCGREKKIKDKIKDYKKKYYNEFKYVVLHPVKRSLDQNEHKDKELRKKAICNIERKIEKNAIREADDEKKYFCGFEENQLLVSFYYNTPNNTLSSFWLPTSISVPLFTRTSYKRLTIDECRKNKERLIENAYGLGTIKK